MRKIKKILYVIPERVGHDAVLAKVFAFAKKKNAHITFLYAMKKPSKKVKKILQTVRQIDVADVVKREMEHQIEQRLGKFKQLKKSKYTIKVVVGDRVKITLDEIKNHDYDVLVTSHFTSKHKLTEKIFGSKNMFLLRQSSIPVLIFRPKRKKKQYNMLVAVDTEEQTQAALALNKKIIDLAFAIGVFENVNIHIIQCWHLYGESSLTSGFMRVKTSELQQMLAETQAAFKDSFDALLGYYSHSKYQYKEHLIKGEPTHVIPEFVKKNKIDMIVMGTTSRSGLRGITIGNTAEDILQSINCSVLAVKPDGFKAR